MSLQSRKSKIQTFKPLIFKDQLIENAQDNLLSDDKINEFFIHSFKEDSVNLKLPLPPHKKTVNDFVLIQKGEMKRTIGLEAFQLGAKDFLLTPKNSITTTKSASDDLEGYYCHFTDEFLGGNPYLRMWHTQSLSRNYLHLSPVQVENLEALLIRILFLYRNRENTSSNYQLIHYYLSTFIAEVSILVQNEAISGSVISSMVSDFGDLVNQNFRKFRSVQKYAALLHVTPNHLNKIVKKETGKNASGIIQETCILEAKALLLQTTLNVEEIAIELGFEDVSYFSRFFKNHSGTSPTFYREMIDLS